MLFFGKSLGIFINVTSTLSSPLGLSVNHNKLRVRIPWLIILIMRIAKYYLRRFNWFESLSLPSHVNLCFLHRKTCLYYRSKWQSDLFNFAFVIIWCTYFILFPKWEFFQDFTVWVSFFVAFFKVLIVIFLSPYGRCIYCVGGGGGGGGGGVCGRIFSCRMEK